MKNRTISVVTALATLLAVWPVLAEREARRAGAAEREQGDRPAVRLRDMSPEERAKLKQRWQSMSEEEREQFRAQMRERLGPRPPELGREGLAKTLDAQVARLKADHEASVGELKEILELANKEKAKQTAKRLEQLIAKHEKQFNERLQAFEARRERLLAAGRERPPRPERVEALEQAGKKAPDFTLKTFDGKTVSLADYKGKIVVLEWLNFECPFSLYHYKTVNTMASLANKYKDKNVVWLAINSTSHTTEQANLDFAKQYKVPFPILDDRPGKVGHAYDAKTTPHMFIIDTNGRIVYEGAIDNAPTGKVAEGQELTNYVDQALAELTAGKKISNPNTKPYGCTVKYPK